MERSSDERRITLSELLDSREKRAMHQQELLKRDNSLLVSVTLNIPGPVKDRPIYRKVMDIALERLISSLPEGSVLCEEQMFLSTGPEGYVLVSQKFLSSEALKRITVKLEEADDLGRLFDMDVLNKDGGVCRADLGRSGRKCLICGDNAKICARSQKHSVEELIDRIDQIIRAAGIEE